MWNENDLIVLDFKRLLFFGFCIFKLFNNIFNSVLWVNGINVFINYLGKMKFMIWLENCWKSL